ncbi:MAG TPA: accessory factor UbiK family protein [Pelagibacterium sp.]|uniref:accessory factor UbiK family protein n=1 Tax=Pelagibacterium sp. TaxID=1967288 RepID=UPI002C2DAC43|nr:accessory factor UbiK family protein [Pelagibacterium sp.]HWJ86987.1 accessory factor UbiK family protein [Pelagibacterium sp.]
MSQGQKFFDDLGRVMNEAASMADGVRREAETAFRGQMERIVNDLDLVKREDFDALRELVSRQAEDLDALRTELDALKSGKADS